MRVLKLCSLFLAIFILIACSTGKDTVDISNANTEEQDARVDSNSENPNEGIDYSNSDLEKIYFAGGCFWGVEAYFERIYGVSETSSGYANGTSTDPTYESVMSGEDGFAETVEVIFDPERVGLNELLAYFFAVIDPTLEDQQGNDVGVQYRTGVFYVDENQKDMIDMAVKQEQTNYDEEIVTEVLPVDNYYLAEEYHQDYLAKNPNGYCHIDMGVLDDLEVDPNVYKPTSASDTQNDLTDEQYYVAMENGTEPAYDNEYWDTYEPGIYVDIVSGEPLFTSTTKYDAECGWPSFTKPINPDAVTFHEDNSAGMIRTEVRSKDGDIHLGHIFDDGPDAEGGDRYCINSAALEFVHLDDMEVKGYGNIIDLVE